MILNKPKRGGLGRVLGGLGDFITGGKTDFDNRDIYKSVKQDTLKGKGPLGGMPDLKGVKKVGEIVSSNKKSPDIKPLSKESSVAAYKKQLKKDQAEKASTSGGNKKIPSIDVTAMRSPDKIKVLGISV